jgi:hypothetical protein
MVDFTINTGELAEWAKKMEEKGADFAAEVIKEVKGHREKRERRFKNLKVRRSKSGSRRFAMRKSESVEAKLLGSGSAKRFKDIFNE